MTRTEKFALAIPEEVGAAIVTGQFNRRYLTGFNSSAGVLIVTRKGSTFIIDSRYYESACATVKDCEVILEEDAFNQIADTLKKYGATTAALESGVCTLKLRNALREKLQGIILLEDDRATDALIRMRACKSSDEIEKMRAAQKITDKAFEHILSFVKPGMSERQIALELEVFGRNNGAEAAAFSFIVGVGSTSSRPHAVPGNEQVTAGELLLMDFGFKFDGYCSDMTRTVAVGHVTDEQREVYQTVLQAAQSAIAAIKPGVPCKEVDAAARNIIDSSPYKGLFGHGLGHSLGLEVHEDPRFNKITDDFLEPGMVLTVEPGIYLPGKFGVRIEDIIALTENGYDNLTSSPKELIVL